MFGAIVIAYCYVLVRGVRSVCRPRQEQAQTQAIDLGGTSSDDALELPLAISPELPTRTVLQP